MYVSEIKQIEFELTSRCNVKCPGCPRTIINNSLDNSLALNDINFDNLKKWLPSKKILQPKNIKFSGNLGDPMVHPNAYEIFEYIGNNYNCNLHIHTNGGMRDEEFWKDLGKLSAYGKTLKDYKNFNLVVRWAIDGLEDTNHIYRVGVDWNILMRNLETYISNGGQAEWHFIAFDFNEHQIEKVKELSKKLGMYFILRKSVRNYSFYINKKKETIKPSSHIQHPKTNTVANLRELEKKQDKGTVKSIDFLQASQTVSCPHIVKSQIFIASNETLWPCCMLWDEHVRKSSFNDILPINDKWNNLNFYNMQWILSSKFYSSLAEMWNVNNSRFTSRCVRSCSEKGELTTKFYDINSNELKEGEKHEHF